MQNESFTTDITVLVTLLVLMQYMLLALQLASLYIQQQ